MSNLEEFWLISVPGDKTPQQAWEKLVQSIDNIANPYKFNIPNLKVGTLDQLFGLSDDLGKLDSFVEKWLRTFAFNISIHKWAFFLCYFSITRKVSQYFSEVLEHEKDKLAENLTANNGIFAEFD